jgi:hypothetical protein
MAIEIWHLKAMLRAQMALEGDQYLHRNNLPVVAML